MADAVKLADLHAATIRPKCDKCGRDGRLSVARLRDRYGHQAGLPDVLREEAACPRWTGASDPCGAHYPELG